MINSCLVQPFDCVVSHSQGVIIFFYHSANCFRQQSKSITNVLPGVMVYIVAHPVHYSTHFSTWFLSIPSSTQRGDEWNWLHATINSKRHERTWSSSALQVTFTLPFPRGEKYSRRRPGIRLLQGLFYATPPGGWKDTWTWSSVVDQSSAPKPDGKLSWTRTTLKCHWNPLWLGLEKTCLFQWKPLSFI